MTIGELLRTQRASARNAVGGEKAPPGYRQGYGANRFVRTPAPSTELYDPIYRMLVSRLERARLLMAESQLFRKLWRDRPCTVIRPLTATADHDLGLVEAAEAVCSAEC